MVLSETRQAQILNETGIVLAAIDRHRREAIAQGRAREAAAMGGLWAGVGIMAQSLTQTKTNKAA